MIHPSIPPETRRTQHSQPRSVAGGRPMAGQAIEQGKASNAGAGKGAQPTSNHPRWFLQCAFRTERSALSPCAPVWCAKWRERKGSLLPHHAFTRWAKYGLGRVVSFTMSLYLAWKEELTFLGGRCCLQYGQYLGLLDKTQVSICPKSVGRLLQLLSNCLFRYLNRIQ